MATKFLANSTAFAFRLIFTPIGPWIDPLSAIAFAFAFTFRRMETPQYVYMIFPIFVTFACIFAFAIWNLCLKLKFPTFVVCEWKCEKGAGVVFAPNL